MSLCQRTERTLRPVLIAAAVWERIQRAIDWLRSPADGLSARVLHGGVWSTLLNVSARGLRLVQLVVLTQFLAPRAFGLVGVALITKQVIQRLTRLGIDPALIQHPDTNVDRYLDTAWLLSAGRGFGIFLAMVAVAPFVANGFGEPAAVPVVVAVGVTTLLQGLVDPSVVYFRKDLQVHKQYVYQVSGTATDLLVSVVLALALGSVWAIVGGLVAGWVVQLVVSHWLGGHGPGLEFDRAAAREMLGFGKWIWATGIVVLLATSGDDAFVGWYLAASALGLYQVAFRLSNAPASEVRDVISSVAFPAFSRLRDDPDQLRMAFARTLRVSLAVIVPMATGIVLVAPAFVRVALGDEWVPMVPAIQALAVAGLLRALVGTGGTLFMGSGNPRLDFTVNSVRTAVIAVSIWPLTAVWGIAGTGASVVLGLLAALPPWVVLTRSLTGISLPTYGRWVLGPAAGAAIMTVPVLAVSGPSLERLVAAVLVGVVTYTLAAGAVYRYQAATPVDDVRSLVASRE